MAVFPTNKITTTEIPDAVANQSLGVNNHTQKHNDMRDEIIAIEAKVGINNSSDTNSVDYKLTNTASVNPGHKHTVSSIDATGTPDNTTFLRGDGSWAASSVSDASTTTKGVSKLSTTPVADPIAVGDNDTRLPTQNENDALVGTSGTEVSSTNKLVDNSDTGTSGANKVLRLDGTGKLPALDGSQLTSLTKPLPTYHKIPSSVGILTSGIANFTFPYDGIKNNNYFYSVTFVSGNAFWNVYKTDGNKIYRTNYIGGATSVVSQCVIGNYVYFADNTNPISIYRRDAITLTNQVTMTISGKTMGFGGEVLFTNGTFLYVTTATNTVSKFSISGTTLTFIADITFNNFTDRSNWVMWCDGINVYAISGNTIRKWALTGGVNTDIDVSKYMLGLQTNNADILKGVVKTDEGDMYLFTSTSNYDGVTMIKIPNI